MGTIVSKICCIHRPIPSLPSSSIILFDEPDYKNEKWGYSDDCCTL